MGPQESTFPAFAEVHSKSQIASEYGELAKHLKQQPKLILVVTAHWETSDAIEISAAAKPSLYYDYYGFPKHTYEISYPAPGSPETASKIKGLLEKAGFKAELNSKRGLDHGVFLPLKMMYVCVARLS